MSADVIWLPASPLEGWASMDRYWRELERVVREAPPHDLRIGCVLPGGAPVKSAEGTRMQRMFEKYVAYPLRARRVRAPLCHVLDHSYAHLLKHLPRSARKVVTVFDLVPLEDPGMMSGAQVERFRRTVQNLKLADHVISISEETRRKLGTMLGIEEERITVAVPGVDAAAFQKTVAADNAVRRRLAGLPKVIFSVGSAVKRKNLESLPGIFGQMREAFVQKSCCFVRAGERLPEGLRREIVSVTGEDGFVEIGPLFGEDLVAAYQAARVLIFPSTLEGLTFVIPEAMAAGCTVVTNRLTANPEAGGDAALYYDEGRHESAARQLLMMLEDDEEHAKRRELGRKRVDEWTWKRHFETVMDVYRQQLSRA